MAVVHGHAPLTDAAIRGDGHMRRRQLIAQGLSDRPRDSCSRIDLVKRVAVPLEELDLAEAQSQNLKTTDGLQKASQRLDVKAFGNDGQFRDRSLKQEHSKQNRPAHHGQSFPCMIPEAFVTSYGFLTIGGVICMVIGGVMLVDSPAGFMRVSLRIIIPFAVATAGVTFFLVSRIIKAQRTLPQTGGGQMLTADAVAVEGFESDGERYRGLVRARGELWRSISSSPVAADQRVEVQGRDGLTLIVKSAGQKKVLSIQEERKSNQEPEDSVKERRKRWF